MISRVQFTECLPVRSGGSPCLNPVWSCWPLRATHSSSKLLFACRHLKIITFTNPVFGEHCYLCLHAGLMCPTKIRWDLRWDCFWKCVYTESNREELQQPDPWLHKIPTHVQQWTSTWKIASTLSSCCQIHCVSGQLLIEWSRRVPREQVWKYKQL